MLERELENAPERVRNLAEGMPTVESVRTTEEARNLANMYIREGTLGKKNYSDALHIAIATVEKATMIVSGNFKHIVRSEKILQYNTINKKEGYASISIESPIQAIEIIELEQTRNK